MHLESLLNGTNTFLFQFEAICSPKAKINKLVWFIHLDFECIIFIYI